MLIEKLRKEAIGEPEWIEEKQAFEYRDYSAKTVALLKIIRAGHGINAINLLRCAGFFIDFGASIRCVNDAVAEIYFLMEKFPEASSNVDRFVQSFFKISIDGYLSAETTTVQSNKIRNATVRVLKGHHEENTRQLMERIYKTFCGYVHANYAHIMEVYNGSEHSFNLLGVPSPTQIRDRAELAEESTISVLHAAAFVARTLGLEGLYQEIMSLSSP